MCDTMVALGNSTADGSVIFAKNSDREPNEAQHMLLVPAADHPSGDMVKCTYIQIPQVSHTNAVLLSKPFWIWGAEMGANEHGVVIGNEAVFCKVPYDKRPGLIGMDFLRLALERAADARQALDVIIQLLQEYGQGGNCGYKHPLYYHNSFIMADPTQAWVLETAGKQWAAEKVRDVRSISNGLTIETQWDLASPDLMDYAIKQGWYKQTGDFNFRKCYSDFLYTRFSDSASRQTCSTEAMRSSKGKISVQNLMSILRSHGFQPSDPITPPGAILRSDICMHAGFGPARGSQSIGSMVASLRPDQSSYWVTGTSAPCTGLFKPVWMDAGLPDLGTAPGGEYNPSTTFWRHEVLHREVIRNYQTRMMSYRSERDQMESDFIREADRLLSTPPGIRRSFSTDCFQREEQSTPGWVEKVTSQPASRLPIYYMDTWRKINIQAKMPNT